MTLATPSLLVEGLKEGLEAHWRLRKNWTNVEPEYLLTVFVADVLGYASLKGGIDADIELEANTWFLSRDCLVGHIGQKEWYRLRRLWRRREVAEKRLRKTSADLAAQHELGVVNTALAGQRVICVGRSGKVDIYVRVSRGQEVVSREVVELKAFDPPNRQIELDVIRLKEFFLLNGAQNDMTKGYLLFAATEQRVVSFLHAVAARELGGTGLNWRVHQGTQSTGVPPEEGLAGYWTLCLEVALQSVLSSSRVQGSEPPRLS